MTGRPGFRGEDRLPLAGELFCIGHDDRTGRSRVHPRVLSIGLAAALLAELALDRCLDVRDGGVLTVATDPPQDSLARSIWDQLHAQPQHRDVRTWLAYLAGLAVEPVAARLVEAGLMQRVEQRRLGRVRVSHTPIDPNDVVWRSMRLARLLASDAPVHPADALLGGLVAITGLVDVVRWLPADRDAVATRITAEVRRLPGSWRRLLAHGEAAVGDAVLTPR